MRQQIFGVRPSVLETPSFKVNRNAVDQTGIVPSTPTQIIFTTRAWDTHGWFNRTLSRYQPLISGKYRFDAWLHISANVVDLTTKTIQFAVNGAAQATITDEVSGTASQGIGGGVTFDLDGQFDYVEVFISVAGAGNKTVSGALADTWFEGRRI